MTERLTKRNSDGSVGINDLRYYNYADFQKIVFKLAYYEDLQERGRLVVLTEGLHKRKLFADLSDKWCPHFFGMDGYMDTDKKKCEKELYCQECWEKALKGE